MNRRVERFAVRTVPFLVGALILLTVWAIGSQIMDGDECQNWHYIPAGKGQVVPVCEQEPGR
jgi:hypothetical protein